MVKGTLNGVMVLPTKVTLAKIILAAKVSIFGLMAGSTLVTGKETK